MNTRFKEVFEEKKQEKDHPSQPSMETARFGYIDGVRALAALYVVLAHAFYEPQNGYYASPLLQHLGLTFGRISVAVFIVVYGFCLMLPIARRQDQMGSLAAFFKKRARRILPPYYITLGLSILFILLFAHTPTGTVWDNSLPLTRSAVACHLLLLHDLPLFSGGRINYPLWSIAVEVQIYLLMPLIVLSIRRLRPALTLLWTLCAGIGLYLLAPAALENAAPWYLSLFTMGALAARFSVRSPARLHGRRWQGICYGACALTALAVFGMGSHRYMQYRFALDQLIGLDVAALLAVSFTDDPRKPSTVTRFLSWRPLVQIGLFSYSLYLIHAVALHALWLVLQKAFHPRPETMFGLLLLCVPLILAMAWLFHIAFERPFMNVRRVQSVDADALAQPQAES